MEEGLYYLAHQKKYVPPLSPIKKAHSASFKTYHILGLGPLQWSRVSENTITGGPL